MALNPIHTYLGRVLAAWVVVSGLLAAEHHGVVKSGGLPIPGATVTATMGDKKIITTTDENGAYAFNNLSDGTWTLEIEMLGFAKFTSQVGIALDAPSPQWELKLLPPGAMAAPRSPSDRRCSCGTGSTVDNAIDCGIGRSCKSGFGYNAARYGSGCARARRPRSTDC